MSKNQVASEDGDWKASSVGKGKVKVMDKLLSELGNKARTLRYRVSKTEDKQAAERHLESLSGIVTTVNALKETIEEKKFTRGESEEDIAEWSKEFEDYLEEADEKTRCLKQQIKSIDLQEQEVETAEKHKKKLQFERELLEQKEEYEMKESCAGNVSQKSPVSTTAAKLPKLSITKFNGKIEEWLPFWGKFMSEIDSSNLACLTKFGYLKELLEKHVRTDIDGLPYTKEGYANAKAILEAEYGQPAEIVNAYVRNIVDLPVITGANPKKVQDFYKQLRFNVQSLDTLGRLPDVKGNVRGTLDKLKGIKADLVRGNENWRDWDFEDLLRELKKWRDINQVEESSMEKTALKCQAQGSSQTTRTRLFNTQDNQHEPRRYVCVYCEEDTHKTVNCPKFVNLDVRKRILAQKRLCFNCTGTKHRAADCKCKVGCLKCHRKHHTSICDQAEQLLVGTGSPTTNVTYPVVIVQVAGIKCRALLDTGAGSSYASAAILDRIPRQRSKKEVRKIEMLLGATTREVELLTIEITGSDGEFSMPVEVTKVNKSELLFLDNPKYQQLIDDNKHLRGVVMDDHDTKSRLPVHIILGASEYAKLKTESAPKIGELGQPVAELTRFGWTIISPGKEPLDLSNMLVTQTSHVDYENLCRLDVLGLSDTPTNDQESVYDEFKEQLTRNKAGWYETGLPWRGNHPELPYNKEGSLRRLVSLTKKLERQELTTLNGEVIEEQKAAGVVESAEEPSVGRVFYIPHKPVVRDTAESTKLRVVYDASARAYDGAPSLNDCLHAGPPLQNKLFNVLVRGRFNPVAVAGDIQKAFLQVRVRADDRDALRFHWQRDEHSPLETLRFTRALFGLASSPFLLGGVIESHLNSWEDKEPEAVAKIRRELYVDDLISGSTSIHKAQELKKKAIAIFKDACLNYTSGIQMYVNWNQHRRQRKRPHMPSNSWAFLKERTPVYSD